MHDIPYQKPGNFLNLFIYINSRHSYNIRSSLSYNFLIIITKSRLEIQQSLFQRLSRRYDMKKEHSLNCDSPLSRLIS